MESACSTLKKVMVAPSSTKPYRILVCLARSSAESMGDSMRSTVRKGGQVCGVGRDDDEGEEPPDSSHDPGGQSLGHQLRP